MTEEAIYEVDDAQTPEGGEAQPPTEAEVVQAQSQPQPLGEAPVVVWGNMYGPMGEKVSITVRGVSPQQVVED